MIELIEFSLRQQPRGIHLVTEEIMKHLPDLPRKGLLEKARAFDPFGHAGLTPLGEIRMTLAGEIKMTPVEASYNRPR